ncbi:MAG: HD domain-containing protein [Spirochaetia bacterium]|jgi:HD-GYP domain-containing protein (c-di-GMP phosphodiesterase class II)|nr:HD domain-containing protein [Spirochaetia bacterium]
MYLRMDQLSLVISRALDIIEKEKFGASKNHSMRVAVLCAAMGRRMGFDGDSLSALTTCALFHDNALTEYMLSEREGELRADNLRLHCEYGQRNVEWLPFKKDVAGFILYHHELEDGSGPFGKKAGEYPFEAALIAVADQVDVRNHLQRVPPEDLPELRWRIREQLGAGVSPKATGALLDVLDGEMLESLRDGAIYAAVEKTVPVWTANIRDPLIIRIAGMVAHVIDYKSVFTKKHSIQIANKSWLMADYYEYTETQKAQLYLAAALHDIGKIATPVEILEKPGRLTDEEFAVIMRHAQYTRDWLCGISGFEDICRWASNHHEKLIGGGYPCGKRAEELDFDSRLLACMDIYQAVCEERPYHPARSHADTMEILYGTAAKGEIDAAIVEDMDGVLAEYSLQDVPPPDPLKERVLDKGKGVA